MQYFSNKRSKPGKSIKNLRRTRQLSFESLEDRRLLALPGREVPEIPETRERDRDHQGPRSNETASPALTIPALHSNPGAAASLYLDFDGHFEQNWGWAGPRTGFLGMLGGAFVSAFTGALGGPLVAAILANEFAESPRTPAFDLDGQRNSLSQLEVDVIEEVWARVAEDYAPFNLDVTTEDPGDFSDGRALRVSIGGEGDWFPGDALGIFLPDAFTTDWDNTGFVFSEKRHPDESHVIQNSPALLAKIISHEAAHGFGLTAGHQDGSLPNRSSIMFPSYNEDRDVVQDDIRTVWYSGVEDDMAIIARADNGFGYRPDDHPHSYNASDSARLATPLVFQRQRWRGAGIIEQTSDADYFSFQASGPVNARVGVVSPGPNLHARLELWNQWGTQLLASSPASSTGLGAALSYDPTGTLEYRLNPGPWQYLLVVRSFGEYGDVGQYTVDAGETSGPRVTHYDAYPDRMRLTFSEPIDISTLTLGADNSGLTDIQVLNRMGVATDVLSITPVDSRHQTFEVVFRPFPEGGYRLELGVNIEDLFGNRMEQRFFVEDFAGPQVVGVNHSHQRLRVNFSEQIMGSSFTTADVTLTGPPPAAAPVSSYVTGVQGTDIIVRSFPAGGYRLLVGPQIIDRFGNPMNQDGDAANGEAADQYETIHRDTVAPRVLDSALAASIVPGLTGQNMLVAFTEDMDLTTFTANTVIIAGPGTARGTFLGISRSSATGFNAGPGPRWNYAVSFSVPAYGSYTLVFNAPTTLRKAARATDLFNNQVRHYTSAAFSIAMTTQRAGPRAELFPLDERLQPLENFAQGFGPQELFLTSARSNLATNPILTPRDQALAAIVEGWPRPTSMPPTADLRAGGVASPTADELRGLALLNVAQETVAGGMLGRPSGPRSP